MEVYGIKLTGVTEENGQKLIFTLVLIASLYIVTLLVRLLIRSIRGKGTLSRAAFWIGQTTRILIGVLTALGLVSIWLDDPSSLSTAAGLATAGLAFALQKVITSFAAYFVILFNNNFTVGDRIAMGGVRGDVIAIGFLQTTIMEMGQPPSVEDSNGRVWVQSRQFTGRIVTVSNGKLFDEPVYNYTRDFEYVWEEIKLPITYQADRDRVEEILLSAARDHTLSIAQMGQESLAAMREKYFVHDAELKPSVYFRITDNWLEMTLRFVVAEHGIRTLKDKMNRQILKELDAAKIGIASATYDIVGLPPIRVERTKRP